MRNIVWKTTVIKQLGVYCWFCYDKTIVHQTEFVFWRVNNCTIKQKSYRRPQSGKLSVCEPRIVLEVKCCDISGWRNRLPFGFVEAMGTTPKYPEVSTLSCMMSSRMLLLQSSPSQSRHVALLLAAEVWINILIRFSSVKFFLCDHIETAFLITVAICLLAQPNIATYHLFTCYVTNAGVWSDEIGVWDFVPQLHPVTVTVEILQIQRRWRSIIHIVMNGICNTIYHKNNVKDL